MSTSTPENAREVKFMFHALFRDTVESLFEHQSKQMNSADGVCNCSIEIDPC